jgi:polysaccharide biosynthesis protein PslG
MLDHLHRIAARLGAVLTMTAAAAAVAAVLAGPAAAFPDPESGFGYNVQSLTRGPGGTTGPKLPPEQWPAFLGLMARDGFRVARADALWGPAEPKAPVDGVHQYDWTAADRIATAMAQQGLRWDMVITGSPRWAAIGDSQFNSPRPEFYDDYAAFARALVGRYGSGGAFWAAHPELPALPVAKYEIWNEPNTSVHWGTAPDPAAYAALFARAQAAVKAADPQASVTVGGIVWNDDVAFIDGFFGALGPGVAVDGLGSHPYAPTVFSLMANVVRVRKALDDLGRASVPLAINELGWPAAYDRPPAQHALDGPVSDAARAGTLSLATDALARSTCDVGDLIIYSLVEGEDDPLNVESFMGLYRRDGSTTLTGAAFADVVARYRAERASPGLPVPVCGPRGAPATRVLPLELQAAPAKGGCAVATVTYRGRPLEEAQVHVPETTTLSTDADGRVLACGARAASRRRPLRITAVVPGVAASNTASCDGRTCASIGPAAACATANLKVSGSVRVATVLRRGLQLQTSGCDPQVGASVQVRAALVVTRAAARRVGLATRAKSLTIGRGTVVLQPGRPARFKAALNAAARRAWRGARRLALTVNVTASEARTVDVTTRKVTLR